MSLSGQQRKNLQLALIDAFPNKASLEQMLSFELDKNLNKIAPDSNLQDIIFKLIQKAEAEGWVENLVHAACKYNPGNLNLQTIAQELLSPSAAVLSLQQLRNRKDLLNAVKFEVTARLEQSLHNAILINLEKELQPQQVKRPWDADIKIGLKPPEPLPENTSIVEVFDSSAIAGKLMILGAPGSGKTTTMLELAQALIARAEADPTYPIPVLFNLSSWNKPLSNWSWRDHRLMTDWLVEELRSKYGFHKDIGKKWLEEKKLLPLLDGLDEVKVHQQPICVYAINQLLQSECRPLYLVLCSRREEYESVENLSRRQILRMDERLYYRIGREYESDPEKFYPLQLNGAIFLQDLTEAQVQVYLQALQQLELWRILQNDTAFLELVRKPLLLNITILVYRELPVEKWHQIDSAAEWSEVLLDAYIQRMLSRLLKSQVYKKREIPNATRVRQWLMFLARQLQNESQTEFWVDKMQLYWVSNSEQIFIYSITAGLIVGLFFGFIVGLFVELYYGLVIGLLAGIGCWTVGLFCGLFFGLCKGLLSTMEEGSHETGKSNCIKHFILRLILYFKGYIPWNYTRFLDYCTEILFLQRVGRRYRFIHKTLQDHFANMKFK